MYSSLINLIPVAFQYSFLKVDLSLFSAPHFNSKDQFYESANRRFSANPSLSRQNRALNWLNRSLTCHVTFSVVGKTGPNKTHALERERYSLVIR